MAEGLPEEDSKRLIGGYRNELLSEAQLADSILKSMGAKAAGAAHQD